jgi:hypothetical protein
LGGGRNQTNKQTNNVWCGINKWAVENYVIRKHCKTFLLPLDLENYWKKEKNLVICNTCKHIINQICTVK